MNKLLSFFILFVLFAIGFSACKDDYEDYSSSPGDVLAFSHDTLSFDTLFSTIGSTTKKLMVYNHNKKPLLISSIQLSGIGRSGFRINVDGRAGHSFSNVEIRPNDSMYVFVETTLKENNNNNPIIMLDSIVFITNTVKQQVILEAYGQDAYICKNGCIIETDSVFKNDKPYLIYDSLVVRENATLTIPEGTSLFMREKARINIRGVLKITGSRDKPVTIRGERLGSLLGISYDKLPGQWAGMYFYPSSFHNEINYAHIRNGVHGISLDSSSLENPKLKIANSVLTNVYYNLFSAVSCDVEAENCEFSNAGQALVSLNGGKYSFTHCTLANYFVWENRKTASLIFKNYIKKGKTDIPIPLLQANFYNCIVYGSSTSEISFDKTETVSDFNYRMDYCLVKMNYEDLNTSYITNYILNKDPMFKTIDRDNVIFDFRLKTGSPAINKGNITYALSVPEDMNGVSRVSDEAPDMGAYEWTPSQ